MRDGIGLILTLVACGLVTFLTRFSFIAGGQRLALGPPAAGPRPAAAGVAALRAAGRAGGADCAGDLCA